MSIFGYRNLTDLEAKVISGKVAPKSSIHISGLYECC